VGNREPNRGEKKMTRKFLMITTAIVALAVAPAVYAQSTSGSNSTASGVNAQPPGANQMMAPKAQSTATQPMQMKDQTMSPKGAAKSADKVQKKDMSKASLKTSSREMNAKEVATTRDLNRQAVKGGVPQQSSMMQGSSNMPTMGALPPKDEVGATGPAIDGSTTNK
jgi:hypothetical protein